MGGQLVGVVAGPRQGIAGAAQVRPVELGGRTVLPKLTDFGGNGRGGQLGRGCADTVIISIVIFDINTINIIVVVMGGTTASNGGSPIPHGPQCRQVLPSPSSAGGELSSQHDGGNISSAVALGWFQCRLFGLGLLSRFVFLTILLVSAFLLLLPGHVGTARLRLGHPIGMEFFGGPDVVNLTVHADHLAQPFVVYGLGLRDVASVSADGGAVDVGRVRPHQVLGLRVLGSGLGLGLGERHCRSSLGLRRSSHGRLSIVTGTTSGRIVVIAISR